jgi:hypothetical protein
MLNRCSEIFVESIGSIDNVGQSVGERPVKQLFVNHLFRKMKILVTHTDKGNPESFAPAERIRSAMERMMKLQDVILKAMAKKITWLQAAEIIGVCDRTIRRMRERYQEFGYDGLFDQRRRKRTTLRVPMEIAERVLSLYQETYFDLSVRHRPLNEIHFGKTAD